MRGYRKDGSKLGFQKGHKANEGRIWPENLRKERSLLYSGKNNPNWKSGIRRGNGYIQVYIENHPYRNSEGYVYQHRLVVEDIICRYLITKEEVHHINKDKEDNRPENLIAFSSKSAHRTFEQKGRVKEDDVIFDGRKYAKGDMAHIVKPRHILPDNKLR